MDKKVFMLGLAVGLSGMVGAVEPVRVILDSDGLVQGGVQMATAMAPLLQSGMQSGVKTLVEATFKEGASTFSTVSKSADFVNDLGQGVANLSQAASNAFGMGLRDFDQQFKAHLAPQLATNMANMGAGFGNALGQGLNGFEGQFDKVIAPEIEKLSFRALSSIVNPRNILYAARQFALSTAIAYSATYGTILAWDVLRAYLLTPRPIALLPNANLGRWDRIKRWMAGYKTPAMIFPQATKDRLVEIADKTKVTLQHRKNGKQVTFDNLLLYGEPGTGKTLFATVLADMTNMDFAPTTAAALLQKDVGVKYLNELIEMAQHSKYGVIIFIDEADALFADRADLDIDSEHYKLLNHFFALTGQGSSKFMLIAATNRSYVMDEAMGRRFQDRVHMPLPDEATRKELIELYMNVLLFNEKDNGKEFVTQAKALLTPSLIMTIARDTEGLSNAEIKDVVHAMRKKAMITKDDILTLTHVQTAVAQGVEKRSANDAEKRQREKAAAQVVHA